LAVPSWKYGALRDIAQAGHFEYVLIALLACDEIAAHIGFGRATAFGK